MKKVLVLFLLFISLYSSEEINFFNACRQYLRVIPNSESHCNMVYEELKQDTSENRRHIALVKYVDIANNSKTFTSYGYIVNLIEPLRRIHSRYCIYLAGKFKDS